MARKAVPDKDKITVVKIWVKKKYVKRAQIEANIIEEKYRKLN
jgi:hypothetical protein